MTLATIASYAPFIRNTGQIIDAFKIEIPNVEKTYSWRNFFRINELAITVLDAFISICEWRRIFPGVLLILRKGELVMRVIQILVQAKMNYNDEEDKNRTDLQAALNLVNVVRIALVFSHVGVGYIIATCAVDLYLRAFLI